MIGSYVGKVDATLTDDKYDGDLSYLTGARPENYIFMGPQLPKESLESHEQNS